MKLVRPLDRYVFSEFMKIFLVTALGFPGLIVIIDLTDNLEKYLGRNLPQKDIALSYLYWIPESMFMVLPAAVLFATVFSIGTFTRYSEITAAKASGISFWRLVMPILLGAILAAGLDLGIGEVMPITSARRSKLLAEDKFRQGTQRFNFAHAAEFGRVYKVSTLNTDSGVMDGLQIERKGNGPDYPTYVLSARQAVFKRIGWALSDGQLAVIPDSSPVIVLQFSQMVDRKLTEKPADMLEKSRLPSEMRYAELTRFIESLERSGGNANVLRVERALKVAIPVTCIIIALFGAPLATSTQRGGTAYGVGISLATTVVFLMLIQMTKAVGGKGFMPPDLAAWIPSMIFGAIGLVLLARVRT
ncbi:MAG: permease YjgP/YjgQ family protein [Gemmatimonadetes bacterium]|nr:permease YjgP/YjgQ family protein [Gemmatimonadota bacterium]